MTPTERNALLRDLANEVATTVAPAIGLNHVPKCHRITRRRGRGYVHGFSVPLWAAANQHYFNYYAAHEVCHAITFSHDARFRAAEAVALSVLGLRPVYANGGAGPYVEALTDLSGFPLVVRIGKDNPTLPPGLSPVL
jgi:hypothetical protein